MAVVKSKRSISSIEFFNTAYNIIEAIITFISNDFGLSKNTNRFYLYLEEKKFPEDTIIKLKELERNGTIVISNNNYEAMERIKDTLYMYANNILTEIIAAYSIFPHYSYECTNKRIHIQNAIENCECLSAYLNIILELFKSRCSEFINVLAGLLIKEVSLLREYKKKQNKIYEDCLRKEEELRRTQAIITASRLHSPFIFNETLISNKDIDFSRPEYPKFNNSI